MKPIKQMMSQKVTTRDGGERWSLAEVVREGLSREVVCQRRLE